ncbi:MAG: ArsR/SmtB family transcription factor [Desulfovibrio sp.]
MTFGKSTKCCPPTSGISRTLADYETRARVMKALAHPSRLMIVEELASGKRCVRDLTTLVGSDISTVSKHLAVLKKAGMVEDEKRGKQVYYRLRIPCVVNFFQCMEAVLSPDE